MRHGSGCGVGRKARGGGDLGQMPQPPQDFRTRAWRGWTSAELSMMWDHPDMTSRELHEFIPRHSPKAIARMRERAGRWMPNRAPVCCSCDERPVWVESPHARRLGLCKGCYLEEQRRRAEEDAAGAAVRKARSRRNGRA